MRDKNHNAQTGSLDADRSRPSLASTVGVFLLIFAVSFGVMAYFQNRGGAADLVESAQGSLEDAGNAEWWEEKGIGAPTKAYNDFMKRKLGKFDSDRLQRQFDDMEARMKKRVQHNQQIFERVSP